MEYKEYLQTDHWRLVRKGKLSKRPICQICYSSEFIQVHHKKYRNYRNNKSILFNERPEDLITLCASCHRLVHHHFGINVKKINKKILRIKRLMELGSTKEMAFALCSQDEVFATTRDLLLSQNMNQQKTPRS